MSGDGNSRARTCAAVLRNSASSCALPFSRGERVGLSARAKHIQLRTISTAVNFISAPLVPNRLQVGVATPPHSYRFRIHSAQRAAQASDIPREELRLIVALSRVVVAAG